MSYNIGFIGAGNMAGAIIAGILKNGIKPDEIAVYDINTEKCGKFSKDGVHVRNSVSELADFSDIVFLAVKPQNYPEVLEQLREPMRGAGKIVVSIAAGISTDYIRSRIGRECKVVRAMPNTPLLLGEGATALCHGPDVTEQEFGAVKEIFRSGGTVEVLEERLMNAVISVNSSSPAYIYLFAKAMMDGAVSQGIDRETARRLISKTLIGSAKMLTDSGHEPDELIRMVSSPGGTTLRALEALYEHDFGKAVVDAMERCTKRAEELGK